MSVYIKILVSLIVALSFSSQIANAATKQRSILFNGAEKKLQLDDKCVVSGADDQFTGAASEASPGSQGGTFWEEGILRTAIPCQATIDGEDFNVIVVKGSKDIQPLFGPFVIGYNPIYCGYNTILNDQYWSCTFDLKGAVDNAKRKVLITREAGDKKAIFTNIFDSATLKPDYCKPKEDKCICTDDDGCNCFPDPASIPDECFSSWKDQPLFSIDNDDVSSFETEMNFKDIGPVHFKYGFEYSKKVDEICKAIKDEYDISAWKADVVKSAVTSASDLNIKIKDYATYQGEDEDGNFITEEDNRDIGYTISAEGMGYEAFVTGLIEICSATKHKTMKGVVIEGLSFQPANSQGAGIQGIKAVGYDITLRGLEFANIAFDAINISAEDSLVKDILISGGGMGKEDMEGFTDEKYALINATGTIEFENINFKDSKFIKYGIRNVGDRDSYFDMIVSGIDFSSLSKEDDALAAFTPIKFAGPVLPSSSADVDCKLDGTKYNYAHALLPDGAKDIKVYQLTTDGRKEVVFADTNQIVTSGVFDGLDLNGAKIKETAVAFELPYVENDVFKYIVEAKSNDKVYSAVIDRKDDGVKLECKKFEPSVGNSGDEDVNPYDPEADYDSDGVKNSEDTHPLNAALSKDSDKDGVDDKYDVYPDDPAKQTKADGTFLGSYDSNDSDMDGVANAVDNCKLIPNPDQKDSDSNGKGDLCEPTVMNKSANPDVGSSGGDEAAGTGLLQNNNHPVNSDSGAYADGDDDNTDSSGGCSLVANSSNKNTSIFILAAFGFLTLLISRKFFQKL